MSLSGNLGFVPLDEVLRLLTRSHQQGSIDVTGDGLRGRVFVGKGGIDLATTFDDDELHRHLVHSRYADEKSLNRITTGETTLAAVAESNTSIVELLREMTVESLFQIGGRGEDFQVREGVTTPYASPKSFELEALLREAEERGREWEAVSDVIPDLTGAVSFRRDLGERDEVTVHVDDWKVLSEIGAGASVERIAEHLGTTKFWTARVVARLVENELIVVNGSHVEPLEDETPYEPLDDAAHETVEDDYPSHDEYVADDSGYPADEFESESTDDSVFQTEAAEERLVSAPNESWWEEPRQDAPDVEEGGDPTPEVVSEGLSEMPSVGGDVDDDDDVEGDTEAFLEKVFSELESSEAPDDDSGSEEPESEEGHGLLRRRRMGSLRDFSSDS